MAEEYPELDSFYRSDLKQPQPDFGNWFAAVDPGNNISSHNFAPEPIEVAAPPKDELPVEAVVDAVHHAVTIEDSSLEAAADGHAFSSSHRETIAMSVLTVIPDRADLADLVATAVDAFAWSCELDQNLPRTYALSRCIDDFVRMLLNANIFHAKLN